MEIIGRHVNVEHVNLPDVEGDDGPETLSKKGHDVAVAAFGEDYCEDAKFARAFRAAGRPWGPHRRIHLSFCTLARRAIEAAAPALLALRERPAGVIAALPLELLCEVLTAVGAAGVASAASSV
jgi:hypothetical protein